MSRSFQLFRLQQIDSQIDNARNHLHQIQAALKQDEELRQAKQQAQAAYDSLEGERKLLRRAEEDVLAQRVKIEQTESTLYGGKVRNPKELQDLQNEAASLKRHLNTLEDRQLEAMLRVEEAEEQQAVAASHLEEVRFQTEQKHSSLQAEQEALMKEAARLETERSATADSISDEDLNMYEKLRQQRRGVAVAKVSDNACAACGSVLNAALLHMARSPSQIVRCDVCGRILYGG